MLRSKPLTVDRPRPGFFLMALFAAFLIRGGELMAEEYEIGQMERAKNAFDAGEYREAVSRFEALLQRQPKNPALVLECHKFLGVSYLFVGDRESAESHFTKLLTIAPDYALDPMVFPIEVVDFFMEIKGENQKRLEALAQARAREEAARKAEEEAKRLAELERLKRNVYLERRRTERSLLVAIVPFGAGQFQNGHPVKGALFLSGEILLAAGAITTYFLHENLRKKAEQPFDSPAKREDAENLELGLRIANHASLVALGVLVAAGIVDSLVHYQKETVEWKPLEENEVPEHLRPGRKKSKAALRPTLDMGENRIGLGLSGRF